MGRTWSWNYCVWGVETGPWRQTVTTDKETNQDRRMEMEKLEEEGTNMKMDLK